LEILIDASASEHIDARDDIITGEGQAWGGASTALTCVQGLSVVTGRVPSSV